MTLNLIRLDPEPQACARWFAAEKLLARDGDDEGYAWHALLCAVFGKALAPKPFRVAARRGRSPQILGYSGEDPGLLLRAALDFADPLALSAAGLARDAPLSAKPMPEFGAGRRLGFSLRVRPTVRTDRGGAREKNAEIDAYVAALRENPGPKPDRKAVYAGWTRAKLESGGAKVVDLRFDGLDQVPVVRRNAERALSRVEGHAANLAGILEVADAEAFSALLARGVGRHRAFGYGMLLLSPP